MNGKEAIIEELIENVDSMLDIIEEQEVVDPDFGIVREVADQLREEIAALQD